MLNYDVTYQSIMGGIITENIENVTAISFNENSFMFWNGKNCVLLIEKDYIITFYPSTIDYQNF